MKVDPFTGSGETIWQSNTYGGADSIAIMQHDGNFVIYGNGAALWNTVTHIHGASTVVVQQCDGNLVLGTTTLRARGDAGTTNIDVA